jgi:hypothetical protein
MRSGRPFDLKYSARWKARAIGVPPVVSHAHRRDAPWKPEHGQDAHATPSPGLHAELKWLLRLSCWFEVARASRPWKPFDLTYSTRWKARAMLVSAAVEDLCIKVWRHAGATS